ncbi:hypothetical protein N7456_012007 [Penicillium angulare]|uniref:DUF6604 domain-containing protein n=1 Tax=Penicillium angulare TaxID=116970 RepID=A0A9W9EV19_9EURO|nr:hypothetical protein N7456_012007 [Penicillium angulare]
MLPEFLQGSYKRYKEDTNAFATWLLEAAVKCGYKPDDFENQGTTSQSGKDKGKKNKKKKKTVNLSASGPVQYFTSIKELQVIAELVAKSSLTVPRPILALARRAINLRKHVTSWFLGQGDSKNNERHAHFISALEIICDTLEWKVNKPSDFNAKHRPATSESGADDAEIDIFLNKFAVLTVEEPRESEPQQQALPESQKVVKVQVLDDDEDEDEGSSFGIKLFKTYCMFQDLHNMRAFISHTWTEYREKKIDLMNAAVVTDSALQLARDLVQDVVNDWGRHIRQSDEPLQELVFNLAILSRGGDSDPSTEVGLPYNKDAADIAEWTFITTTVILRSFAGVLDLNNALPVFKKGCLGVYDPKENRGAMSAGQKFKEDQIILFELLPQFCMLDMFNIRTPARDTITTAIVEYIKNKRVTPFVAFAGQILLDIHHIMRYSSMSAYADLRMSGLRIQITIDEHFKLSKTHPKPPFWPKEGDAEIKAIYTTVEAWAIDDMLWSVQSRGPGRDNLPVSEKHLLLTQHSLLSGLILFHINLRMQTIGQKLITQWYDVQQLAFLYNLITMSPMYKNLKWPDMEAFIKIHGESHIFVGSRPQNVTESLNRLELASGIASATRFARDSRNNGRDFHPPDGKVARILTPTTTVANLYRDQYVHTPRPDQQYGIASIDTVLDQLSEHTAVKGKGKDKGKEAVPSNNAQAMFQRKWANTRRIDALQILALVKSKLFEEEPVILFNYFGMHKRCIELLRLIKVKEDHKFAQYFTPEYMPDESLIAGLVILVLHVARGSAKNAQELGFPRRGGLALSRIVMSCAEVMRDYLEKNGDIACKELKIFCKNKAQIQDVIEQGESGADNHYYFFTLEDVLGPTGLASLMTGIPVA